MKNSQLEVSFLDPQLLKKLCCSYGAADSAYQSYSAAGLTYFKSDMSEPAFLEFGGALQISHVQISNSETRSWRWAARLVESTNKVIVTLNEIQCHDLVAPLLRKVSNELHAVLKSEDWGQGKEAAKLSDWCSAMYCPERQKTMASLYRTKAELVGTPLSHH